MNDETKKQHTATLVKWGVIGVTAAVIAPLAWMAVTGIAGLMIAGGLVIVGTNVAPWLALRAANLRYRAMDAERVTHIAKSQLGDTNRYTDIQSRNNLANPNFIAVGQKLVIPK